MMLTGRVIAVILLIAAGAVTLQDAVHWSNAGVLTVTVVGALSDRLLAALRLSEPALQSHIPGWLWDNVIVYVLQLWAAPAFALPGLVLLWETRGRRRRGTRLE
jgi:hypothetical protein